MDSSIVLLPQVTIDDLHVAVDSMNVVDFMERTRPLVPYVPDVAERGEVALLRALLEVDVPDEADSLPEWLAKYIDAGVTNDWLALIVQLRLRGLAKSSALVHREALDAARFVVERNGETLHVSRSDFGGRRTELLRPLARTLGLEFRREPGSWEEARVPPHPKAPAPELDALVDALAERIRPTVGGDQYLATGTAPRALSVLAATVAAVLRHKSSQRTYGNRRVVRADVYKRVFDALDLAPFFETARRVLEQGHPHSLPMDGPWPPGLNIGSRRLNVLRYRDGLLALDDAAVLETLPDGTS